MASGRYTFLRVGVVTVVCLALNGCLEYNEEIRLNPDGSGTVRVHGQIDYNAAMRYYDGPSDPVRPPLTRAIVDSLLVGSEAVSISEISVLPEAGRWVYDITVYFSSISELARTSYFRNRAISVGLESPRELGFSASVSPTPFEVARDHAQTFRDNPYSAGFVEAYDTDQIRTHIERSRLSYLVSMRGIEGTGTADIVQPVRGGLVEARWQFAAAAVLNGRRDARLQLTTRLPGERGFTEVVILILLASVIGIIVAAVRLVILKMQGAS